MILNYFKITGRKLLKDRLFTFLNLAGLSTGLACSILIFLGIADEQQVDSFHEKDKHLFKVMYNIRTADEILTLDHTPSPLAESLLKEMPEVEKAVSVNTFTDWFEGQGVVSNEHKNKKVKGIFASPDYFNVFSFPLILGDKNQVVADKQGVVISKQLAILLFDSPENSIGKAVNWDHRMNLPGPFRVTGVFGDLPTNSTSQFEIIFNYERLYEVDPYARNWNAAYAETYLVLKQGIQVKEFNDKIAGFSGSKAPSNENCSLFVQQFSKKYLYGKFENGMQAGGRIQYIHLFQAIAWFILIIACINFMNLSTAQASGKMKEVGIKKTLGAGRGVLIFQFLGESMLLSLVAMVLALGMVNGLLPYFNELTDKPLSIGLNSNALVSLAGLWILIGILSGSYPAFYLSGFNPVAGLKAKVKTTWNEIKVRQGLVVFQFALSVIFILGFLIIGRQMDFIQKRNLGYQRDHILSFKREGLVGNENPETFLAELKRLPGVLNVASMPGNFLDGNDAQSGFSWRGQKADEAYSFNSPRVGFDVIETLGMEILQGRSFAREFNDDDTKIILNESAVNKMQLESPIGKMIKTGNSESQVIGVVKDFQYGSLHQFIEPLIFRFRSPRVGNNVLVKMQAVAEAFTIRQIEARYKQFHPKYPFEFTFLDKDYNALYTSELRMGKLSRHFAGLAILISCLGLFGLAAFSAQKRQKEIAIRKVLGASAHRVFLLLSKDFMKLIFLAALMAFPLAWWSMNKWLLGFAYRVEIGPEVFLMTLGILTMITGATVGFQALKAAVTNPVKSLKME